MRSGGFPLATLNITKYASFKDCGWRAEKAAKEDAREKGKGKGGEKGRAEQDTKTRRAKGRETKKSDPESAMQKRQKRHQS